MLASAPAGLLSVNGTLIAEAIVFLIMVAVLWRWAYPWVIEKAEARERTIEAGLQHAQEAEQRLTEVRAEVEKLLEEARAQAHEIADRAHRSAAAEAELVRAQANHEAKAFAEQARADIAAERDRALREMRAQVGALVVAAAARVVGDAMDVEAHRKLVEQSLQSLETLPR